MKNTILGTVTATMIAISSFTFTPAQAGMMQDIESAQQKARTTLPDFWKKLKAPASGEKNFALMIKHQGGHMWLGGISRNGNQITGIVDKELTDMEDAKGLKLGQSVSIAEKDIVDWLYTRNGRIVGNQSLRVLIKINPALAKRWEGKLE